VERSGVRVVRRRALAWEASSALAPASSLHLSSPRASRYGKKFITRSSPSLPLLSAEPVTQISQQLYDVCGGELDRVLSEIQDFKRSFSPILRHPSVSAAA